MPKKSNGLFDLNDLTVDNKRYLYNYCFSLGTNTVQKFEHKLELMTLLCGLTQQMQKHFPGDWKNSWEVLKDFVYQDKILEFGEDNFLSGLSILCDDLMYGVDEIQLPFKTAKETKARIRDLVAEWLPF